MSSIRVASPAKLNLFLHITGQRADGYHELQTLFQLIDLSDYLTFHPTQTDQIHIDGLTSVNLHDNLIYRAAMQLKPYASPQAGCQIQLEKYIPMGAGLGGGSSNAATTLLILNQLWNCQLSQTQLLKIAATLGADVPIFVYGQNAWAEGIGDLIHPIPQLAKKHYLILKPDCFISTQLLFSQKTLTRNTKPTKFAAYQENTSVFGNDFEALARQLFPPVEQAFLYLNQYGQAKLTGTGACVFIELDCNCDIDEILAHAPYQAYVAKGLNHSPVLDQLQLL